MKFLSYKNYLTVIKNSVGSKMFKHVYISENNKEKDILENGEYSCAYYVSCILKMFNLINQETSPHAMISGLIKNILNYGWKETKKLKPGNILIWEDGLATDGKMHSHIGFYLEKNKAISTIPRVSVVIIRGNNKIFLSDKGLGLPKVHHYTYGQTKDGQPKRKIIKIFTHKIIE